MKVKCLEQINIFTQEKINILLLEKNSHWFIGRSKNCHFQIEGGSVSRIHLTVVSLCAINISFFRYRGQLGFLALDGEFGKKPSTNGLFINEKRVRSKILEINDRIKIGDYILIYKESEYKVSDSDSTMGGECHH